MGIRRFIGDRGIGRARERDASRAKGAGSAPSPQASVGASVWVALLAGCATARPEAPNPTPIPVDPERLAMPVEGPEPGVEHRFAADRAGIDVEHYRLVIDLSDPASGELTGVATLRVRLAEGLDRVALDFAGLGVTSVDVDGASAPHRHVGGVLGVGPIEPSSGTSVRELRIAYAGTPEDGLFFGEDARGDPAVFADNWPNRARWWFPSNDDPADKATVRFEVTVPADYAVIANGALAEIRPHRGDRATWIWETHPDAPIPPYTMVIGAARFDRRVLGTAACGSAPAAPGEGACVDVAAWALAGGGDYGAERFARGPDMVDFYTGLLGPYPYEKLVHVQSSTRFGGMENSSAIFYARGGWESERMGEGVIAHETAHQWFGDAVTPASWYQLWVSEGFASYFGPLYFEARDGPETLLATMRRTREAVARADVVGQAIVDSSTNRLFDLLNSNNYQKGAWVLHMLRHRLGDEAFFRAARDYYRGAVHGVGDTDAVQRAFERASGEDLAAFFDQWVRSPGVPRLEIAWGPSGDDLVLEISQTQPEDWPTFRLPVEIEVERADGSRERVRTELSRRSERVTVPGAADAVGISFDPEVKVLATAELARLGG